MDTMSKILTTLRVEDVPAQDARPFRAVGLIGEIEQREVSNGYVQVTVPLTYRLSQADQNDRTFYARFNLRPEWLTPEFAAKARAGQLEQKEMVQYNINVRGLLRGLFTGAGITEGEMDFTSLTGRLVEFKTKLRRDDPSRLDISFFSKPRG